MSRGREGVVCEAIISSRRAFSSELVCCGPTATVWLHGPLPSCGFNLEMRLLASVSSSNEMPKNNTKKFRRSL
eukprot:4207300-Pleurochrysis_carterae.AAC.2